MDRQRRSRYVLAVYLVVLGLAIVLVLAGLFFTTSPDWKAVWINLGTGLLGVVVLFFLVQRFFLADEWGLSDRIEQLEPDHHRSTEDNPTFELRAARDGEWYAFFRRQFDLMWASCRVVKLTATP